MFAPFKGGFSSAGAVFGWNSLVLPLAITLIFLLQNQEGTEDLNAQLTGQGGEG